MTEHRVVFTPSGKRGAFADGTSLLDAARRLGVDLDLVCGGRGICGRCQVDVAEGAFAKHGLEFARAQRKPVERDRRALRRKARRSSARPAPRLPDEDLRRPRRRRAAGKPGPPPGRAETRRRARPIAIDPVVRLHTVEVREPDMRDPSSDFRRLQEALAEQWGIADATADLAVAEDAAEGAPRRPLDRDRRDTQRTGDRRDLSRASR